MQLTHLHLGATNMGDAGVELLARALRVNYWLTALYLQVSIRQHTYAYVAAYVSIRQHT